MMPVSTSSIGATKQKKKKHRLINRTAVDESLFGSPARLKQMTGNRKWNDSSEGTIMTTASSSRSSARRMSDDPEVVQIITKDLIRKLKVPCTPDPSGASVVLDDKEYNRILQNATVVSPTRKKQMEETKKAERTARVEASTSRKKAMHELELTRKKNEKLTDLEQESLETGNELVAKAKSMLEEQDDEIKRLNQVILNAKCHAIRDAQIREKEEMLKSMKDEEARLDTMMEIQRLKAVQEYEKRERDIQLQRFKGAEMIQEQINSREQQRSLDMEKKDQETKAMIQYLERLQQEDLENLRKKKMSQASLMEEVIKCNEEIQRQKAQQREQMKLEDLKVLEYLKDKERREEEFQQEMDRQKAEKEREVARLRAQQERAQDKQAERDALRAKRRQEEYERAARRKEKEEAEKKKNTEEMLIEARQQQIATKEHFLAMQAKQDRNEFERVLMVQRELMEQERQKEEEQASGRQAHAKEIRKQVREKEEERVAARKAFFEEGVRLDHEAKERRKKLDEIKQRKLEELRAAGIPDKYCAEISRRITAPPPSFTMSTLS